MLSVISPSTDSVSSVSNASLLEVTTTVMRVESSGSTRTVRRNASLLVVVAGRATGCGRQPAREHNVATAATARLEPLVRSVVLRLLIGADGRTGLEVSARGQAPAAADGGFGSQTLLEAG